MADKKRLIPVAFILGAVVIGMGVFQFAGNSGEEDPAGGETQKPERVRKTDGTEVAQNPDDSGLSVLSPRDPFKPDEMPTLETNNSTPPTIEPTPPPPVTTTKSTNSGGGRRNSWKGGSGSAGTLQPLPPFGSTPTTSTNTGASSLPATDSASTETPTVSDDPPPSFTLSGIVEGERPVALIKDGTGGQRLARAGEMIDGVYRVKAISRQGVVVDNGKKSYVIRLGGAASGTK